MNRKIVPYVNFLFDNSSSPFCEYIVLKELLEADAQSVKDAHDWAAGYKLYTEIRDEQFADGSWGGYIDALSSTDAKHRKHKATSRTVGRLIDLSLDASDAMVAKVVDYCKKSVSGEIVPICVRQLPSHNVVQRNNIMHAVHSDLARFLPDDSHVANMRDKAAEHFKKCCASGKVDMSAWEQRPLFSSYDYRPLTHMLSYGDVITEDEQRVLLSDGWKNGPFGFDLTEPLMTDDPNFIFWMIGLEHFKAFSLFREFMTEKIEPYLSALCSRLIDPDDQIPIYVNRYYGKMGQYSESWNKHDVKKKDLLLRVIRVLNKCG